MAAAQRELNQIETEVASLAEQSEMPPPPSNLAASLAGILDQVESLKATMRGE